MSFMRAFLQLWESPHLEHVIIFFRIVNMLYNRKLLKGDFNMNNLYVLSSVQTLFNASYDESYEICGIFDDITKAREIANKILTRTRKIVGEEKVKSESFNDIWYENADGIETRYKLQITKVGEINEEL